MKTAYWIQSVTGLLCLTWMAAGTAGSVPQEEVKTPGIVGTWEWSLEVGPKGHKAKMVVREKDGKLSAVITAPDGKELTPKDMSAKDNRVTFTIRPEMGLMTVVMYHDGKLKGDEIIGTVKMKGSFMRQEVKWHAKRVTEE